MMYSFKKWKNINKYEGRILLLLLLVLLLPLPLPLPLPPPPPPLLLHPFIGLFSTTIWVS